MSQPLEWLEDAPGVYVAFATVRTYRIRYETADRGYWAKIDGYPIGSAETLDGAKAIAQGHNDR